MSTNRNLEAEASEPRLTRSQYKQQTKQVTCIDKSCFDNLSCHGSKLSITKRSCVGSSFSSRTSKTKSSIHVTRAEIETIELEQAVLDKKRAFKLQQLKLDEHLARLSVEKEEEEKEEYLERLESPIEDAEHKVQEYLQRYTLTPRQINYETERDEKSPYKQEERVKRQEDTAPYNYKQDASKVNQREDMMPCNFRLDMPKVELAAFYGETSDYWRFTKQFEYYIENRTSDPGQRMLYLSSYCKGLAMEEIKSCIALPPDRAYNIARKRLKERFGLPHIISRNTIEEILSFPKLHNNDPTMLSKLAAVLIDSRVILEEMNHLADLNSSVTLEKIISKLPIELRQQWAVKADEVYSRDGEPGIDELTKFLDDQARIARSAYGRLVRKPEDNIKVTTHSGASKGARIPINYRSNVNLVGQVNKTQPSAKCSMCNDEHELTKCQAFTKLEVNQRWQWIKERKLCFLCLRPNHQVQQCRRQNNCVVQGCGRRHNELLHLVVKNEPKPIANVNACSKREIVHMGTVPVKIKGPNSETVTYALLDNGSDSTFVKSSLLRQLGMIGSPIKLKIRTLTGERNIDCEKMNLTIESISEDYKLRLTDVFTSKDLLQNTQAESPAKVASKLEYLDDIRFDDIGTREIGLLIGRDNPEALWVLDQKVGKGKQPFAIKSGLGWLLLGPNNRKGRSACVRTTMTEEQETWEYLRMIYDQEFGDLGQAGKELSRDEQQACKTLESGCCFEEGRYTIPLPWKEDRPTLPNNFAYAQRRLMLLKKRFDKMDGLYERYKGVMNDHINKGYLELVCDPNSRLEQDVWYLPHHPVFNAKKPDKLRVVLDCAAKLNNVSLNDCLLTGPDTLTDLMGVLMRFRKKAIALTADIQEMFLQVKLPLTDRRMMRVLWWDTDNLDEEPKIYQMTVHPFGATSSPFCANFALNKALSDFGQDADDLTKMVASKDIYVDDCITSADNIQEAIMVANQLSTIYKRAGFRLRGWTSNKRQVLESIPESELSNKIVSLSTDKLPTERTLGIEWDTELDSLKFSTDIEEKPETRRGVLANVASMFDPLGLLSPFTLIARILLQDLCRVGKGWDEPLNENESKRWRDWKSQWSEIKKLRIPRQVTHSNSWQLHLFSDASEKGYGAVAYIRSEVGVQQWCCRLLLAKSKVAPIKTVSVPRLELTAAVLATRLCRVIIKQFESNFDKLIFWTDSVLVLRYINNTTSRFVTFVANRVQEILECSSTDQWRYVNTKENPADLASRGMLVTKETTARWLHGPEFLLKPEETWRNEKDIPDGNATMETRRILTTGVEQIVKLPMDYLLEYFSSWRKLRRSVAWLSRWKAYRLVISGKRDKLLLGSLTVVELDLAEKDIFTYVQRTAYPKEYATIVQKTRNNDRVNLLHSNLRKLNPIEHDNLLCVGSRLIGAEISETSKHPIIIPRRHAVTNCLIWDIHINERHAGKDHLISILREKFWVVNVKAVVKKILRKCLTCRKQNAPLAKQQMAPLPLSRIRPGWRPFTHVGIDYFGPFSVKGGRLTEKRYGCLFTCMQCRAIHIELVQAMSTESFLLAMARFIDRRGTPTEIYSDNGGNFIGADKEIQDTIKKWNIDKLSVHLSEHNIKWNFNPPLASHRGGIWERMVRSVRKIVYNTIGPRSIDEELLHTYLTQAERIINDRPLVPMTESDLDTKPIRPSDLLRPRENSEFDIDEPLSKISIKRWKELNDTTQHFWNRWRREYLHTLHLRQKWMTPERKFKVGDLVILWTEYVPKSYWPMGVITGVIEGEDHLVRTVEVRTNKGTLRRDVRKICLVEGVE